MKTQNYTPITNNLALTVRKEHRLIIMKKAAKDTFRITWKILSYALLLTVLNIVVQKI